MERMPIENNRRVVNVTPEEQNKFRQELQNIGDSTEFLSDHDIDKFEGFEEMFSFLQEKLVTFLSEYGLKHPTHFTPESIILTEDHPYGRFHGASASWQSEFQKIEVYRDWKAGNRLGFIAVLVHEMIHAQAFQSWQKVSEEDRGDRDVVVPNDGGTEPYSYYQARRQGLNLYTKDDKAYLGDVDEAVTEELAIRFMKKNRNVFPFLKEEVALRDKVVEKNFEPDPEINHEIRSVDLSKTRRGYLDLERASYREERVNLRNMIDSLYEANKDTFSTPEDVFKIIATASMTGNILPFARLYESTFGKGSFRTLCEGTA